MKSFYSKLVIFAFVNIFFIILSSFLSTTDSFRMPIAKLTHSEEFITINNGPDEIGPYIDKAREKNTYSKLIIGDSVCHQMFTDLQCYNDDVCIIGSNAAITMAGQYVLLHEFLENHTDVTDVWLIIIPTSLSTYFDKYYGYQYIVMPNVEKGTINLLDNDSVEQLKEVYGKMFLQPQVVSFLDKSAPWRKIYLNCLLKSKDKYDNAAISSVSFLYIDKMNMLCSERDVKLHLLPCPLSEEKKEDYREVLENFQESELNSIFPDYIKRIKYYPDDQFRDGIHFGGEYDDQNEFNRKIVQLADESLMSYLKFE